MLKICEKLCSNRVVTTLGLITLGIFLAAGVIWQVNNPHTEGDKNSISSILLVIGIWTYVVILGLVRECIVRKAVAESKNSDQKK